MKNVSTFKSNNTPSPKTPGGISKSLLTPCRRLGLSRNWKKSGPSPFRSPLASSGEVKEDKTETRKRKERVVDEDIEVTAETSIIANTVSENVDTECTVNKTPSRNVDLPRRKKSKTMLSTLNKSQGDSADTDVMSKETTEEPVITQSPECKDVVSTPVRSKSKKIKKMSPMKKSNIVEIENYVQQCDLNENNTTPKATEQNLVSTTERSPNDLTKECIVVIQKKIFKKLINPEDSASQTDANIVKDKKENCTSQTIFDSDSDEVPLCNLNNKDQAIDEDDDFIEKTNKIKPTRELKSPKVKPKKSKPAKTIIVKAVVEPKPSQTSYDDDDDDFDDKKTILIRKTYEKIHKPQKAKSTGSITQRDIDELKARIEAKKKFLLAKSVAPETAELRCLIKRWQKGCQDALTELLELMRGKFPDQNMDFAEMLKTLKIPASLVGYDSDNDCFNTPNDEDIILGQFNDL